MIAPTTIGFIGIGTMGWPMATNLARAGHRLVALDVDRAVEARFAAEHDATPTDGRPERFAAVDAVVTMLPTGQIVRSALLDGDGAVAPHLRAGTVVIDMSSSDPAGTRALGAELAARGLPLVDAPVSGGLPKARDATLAIMLGGDDEEAIERALPIIDAMSERVVRTGPLGSGHAMKALNNFVAAAGFAAACEALLVGGRFGLEPEVMAEVLNSSTGRNFTTENTLLSEILPRRFASGFSLALMTKDVGIAAGLARDVDVDAPVCANVHARLAEALDALGEGADHTAALLHWERPAG